MFDLKLSKFQETAHQLPTSTQFQPSWEAGSLLKWTLLASQWLADPRQEVSRKIWPEHLAQEPINMYDLMLPNERLPATPCWDAVTCPEVCSRMFHHLFYYLSSCSTPSLGMMPRFYMLPGYKLNITMLICL